jgi:hypothetical protein
MIPSVVGDVLEERVLMSHASLPDSLHRPAARVDTSPAPARAAKEIAPATARWSWLAGTYWYVPAPNSPAVLYAPGSRALAPVLDQTVFQITGYANGYFWGVSVTQLGSGTPVSSTMIGSVTPEGRVLLNFTQVNESSEPTVTQGIGQMRLKHC